MRMNIRHVNKVTAKGRVYFYHRLTGARLPDSPRSPEFLTAVLAQTAAASAVAGTISRSRREFPERLRVYFLRAPSGRIKIGVANDPSRRLNDIQTAHDGPLELLAVQPGGCELERTLHERFAAARTSGEWFDAVPDLTAYIAAIATPSPISCG